MPGIALTLLDIDADVIVLSEFRTSMGGQLRGLLADHGWRSQVCTDPPRGVNGMLIAARTPLEPLPPDPDVPESLRQRWVDARLPEWDLLVSGVHVPEVGRVTAHAAAWQFLLAMGRRRLDQDWVLIGDLNTGRRGEDSPAEAGRSPCEVVLATLLTLGYRDAWRASNPAGPMSERDATWYSPDGRPYRLDAAIVSPRLHPRLGPLEHRQEAQQDGWSDHAPVVLTLLS